MKWETKKQDGDLLGRMKKDQCRRKGRKKGKITLRLLGKASRNHNISYLPKIIHKYI